MEFPILSFRLIMSYVINYFYPLTHPVSHSFTLPLSLSLFLTYTLSFIVYLSLCLFPPHLFLSPSLYPICLLFSLSQSHHFFLSLFLSHLSSFSFSLTNLSLTLILSLSLLSFSLILSLSSLSLNHPLCLYLYLNFTHLCFTPNSYNIKCINESLVKLSQNKLCFYSVSQPKGLPLTFGLSTMDDMMKSELWNM